MVEGIRLSEVSAQVTAALAALDASALGELTVRLNQVAHGTLTFEPERTETVERELLILGQVLVATEQNLNVLQGLRERKARQAWEL